MGIFQLKKKPILHDLHKNCSKEIQFENGRNEKESGKIREKCAEKVRESQGIQIELTGGNPAINNGLRMHVLLIENVILKKILIARPKVYSLCSNHFFLRRGTTISAVFAPPHRK